MQVFELQRKEREGNKLQRDGEHGCGASNGTIYYGRHASPLLDRDTMRGDLHTHHLARFYLSKVKLFYIRTIVATPIVTWYDIPVLSLPQPFGPDQTVPNIAHGTRSRQQTQVCTPKKSAGTGGIASDGGPLNEPRRSTLVKLREDDSRSMWCEVPFTSDVA